MRTSIVIPAHNEGDAPIFLDGHCKPEPGSRPRMVDVEAADSDAEEEEEEGVDFGCAPSTLTLTTTTDTAAMSRQR